CRCLCWPGYGLAGWPRAVLLVVVAKQPPRPAQLLLRRRLERLLAAGLEAAKPGQNCHWIIGAIALHALCQSGRHFGRHSRPFSLSFFLDTPDWVGWLAGV